MKKIVVLVLSMILIFTACAKESMVEVTLPASIFEGKDASEWMDSDKHDDIEVTVNDDGSVTYKMPKSTHDEVMKEIRAGFDNVIAEIKDENGEYVSIKDVTYNDSFSEITLIVDKEKYQSSFDGIVSISLGFSGMFYQVFDGVDAENIKTTIDIKDIDSGEVFNTIVYPDVFGELVDGMSEVAKGLEELAEGLDELSSELDD
jgi:X-X-X-Leu-X-X-Gly heptad repeat protein